MYSQVKRIALGRKIKSNCLLACCNRSCARHAPTVLRRALSQPERHYNALLLFTTVRAVARAHVFCVAAK